MRLLIAEDDSVTRLILSAAVERSGHEITAVADGATAWEALQKGEYSVVISDWEMPAMNGAEMGRRIRTGPTEQPPSPPAAARGPASDLLLLQADRGSGEGVPL